MGWTSTFFGNAKSSSSSSTTNNYTTNIDKRLVVDGGGLGISADQSTVTVNQSVTDHGALTVADRIAAGAFDLAKTSNAQTYKSLEGVLGLAGNLFDVQDRTNRKVIDASADLRADALDAAADVRAAFESAANIAAGNKTLVSAGLAVVGLAAIGFALTRWKAA